MEKKFNIGDRVRFKGDYLQYVEDAVSNGGEYLITDVGHDSSEVTLHCPVFIDNDDLELVEPYDPKTAFLSDLAAVLRKHNAVMDIAFGDKCVGIMITIPNEKLLLPISTEIAPASQTWLLGEYSHTPITADNIMEYDKE